MDITVATEIVRTNGKGVYLVGTPTGLDRLRLAISNGGEVMQMARKSRRHGYLIADATITGWSSLAKPTQKISEEQRWFKAWRKVLRILEATGFWEDLRAEIAGGLEVGLKAIKWQNSSEWKTADEITDPRLKPSFVRSQMSGLPRVKAMRFRREKWYNDQYRQQIVDAVASNKHLRIDTRADYDVTFEFHPKGEVKDGVPNPFHRAYYSEEFRGMGNGHYYLAIDTRHALFMEDD